MAAVTCNLDLAASVIKKAAQDKAVYDVDETLTPAFALRRKHREVRSIGVFFKLAFPQLYLTWLKLL